MRPSLSFLFASPVIKRLAWYSRRAQKSMDRRFFLSLVMGIFLFTALAALAVTLLEKPWTVDSLGTSFYWGITTIFGGRIRRHLPPGRLARQRPAQAEPDVFDLTDEMALPDPAPAASSFHKIDPQDDIEFTESAAAKALHRQPAFEPPPFESAAAAAPAQQILSRSTVSAVESAFNSLANTVLSNNARTLEDLVKEMLRPMLKSWLDDNLPGLVERIVKAEIERVSRGR